MSSLASQETVFKNMSSPASQETVFKDIFPSLSGDYIQGCVLPSLSGDCIQRGVLPSLSGDCIQRGNYISISLLVAVVGILWEACFHTLLTVIASLLYLISFLSICCYIFLLGTHLWGLRLLIRYRHSGNRCSLPQRHVFFDKTGELF